MVRTFELHRMLRDCVAQEIRNQYVVKEAQRLKEEQGQVEGELRHLRELMQAEVDVEPDEGDAENIEREECRPDLRPRAPPE